MVKISIDKLYKSFGEKKVLRGVTLDVFEGEILCIIGKSGTAEKDIEPGRDGLVKIGYEEWRARSEHAIKAGEEIIVTGISGVTLTVKKAEGGK